MDFNKPRTPNPEPGNLVTENKWLYTNKLSLSQSLASRLL